jgi:hypothetical protein
MRSLKPLRSRELPIRQCLLRLLRGVKRLHPFFGDSRRSAWLTFESRNARLLRGGCAVSIICCVDLIS